MKRLIGAKTPLQKAVQSILNNKIEKDYLLKNVLDDLLTYGCQSGVIGEMVYYNETLKFYKKYKYEIQIILRELMEECGNDSPAKLFGDKWDKGDMFAEESNNQNLLAWFGFEETARTLAYENKIEV